MWPRHPGWNTHNTCTLELRPRVQQQHFPVLFLAIGGSRQELSRSRASSQSHDATFKNAIMRKCEAEALRVDLSTLSRGSMCHVAKPTIGGARRRELYPRHSRGLFAVSAAITLVGHATEYETLLMQCMQLRGRSAMRAAGLPPAAAGPRVAPSRPSGGYERYRLRRGHQRRPGAEHRAYCSAAQQLLTPRGGGLRPTRSTDAVQSQLYS